MKRKPTHPGIVLKEDILKPLGLSVTQAAEYLDISRKTLSSIINERQAITSNIAMRIGLATRTSPQSWLNMQDKLNLWKEENKDYNIVPFPQISEELMEM